MTPQGPKPNEIQDYLSTNPEGIETDDVVESDEGDDDGSGD